MMLLFPPSPVVSPEDGFAKDDLFQRKSIGDSLTSLIRSIDEPLVIAVDAQWGDGKTTFLKMWAGELRKLKIPVVMIDAYENDYVDDAFIAVAGEIIAIADECEKPTSPATKTFIDSAKKTGRILLRSAAIAPEIGSRSSFFRAHTPKVTARIVGFYL